VENGRPLAIGFRRLKPQDLVIDLMEVAWENWSFGNGEAQYMDT
jgi:hypothetical protein